MHTVHCLTISYWQSPRAIDRVNVIPIYIYICFIIDIEYSLIINIENYIIYKCNPAKNSTGHF